MVPQHKGSLPHALAYVPNKPNRAQHDATRKAGTQYKSAIWYQTQEQRNVALESMKKEEAKPFYRGRSIVTDVAPLRKFFLAEDYHQVLL
tara:strand:- start:27 stop:296 length:270 start_codon:yes stop_codon:yes gene_type:complete